MKSKKTLRSRAMDLLSRREYSQQELKIKLSKFIETENEYEELKKIITELSKNKWQSDERYTEVYINSKKRLHGNIRIKYELASKGIEDHLIDGMLPTRDSEINSAKIIIRKKYNHSAADLIEKNKQIRFLLYRGFDMELIKEVLKDKW